jgi:hypothetical protein
VASDYLRSGSSEPAELPTEVKEVLAMFAICLSWRHDYVALWPDTLPEITEEREVPIACKRIDKHMVVNERWTHAIILII